MTTSLQAIRGMNDILPDEMVYWHQIESVCRQMASLYAYQEIRFPVLEKTALFLRSIGEETDIVSKEMYTFDDKNGESLTLRPEGTASCVRACIQGGLLRHQVQRLWYLGPMFRHERPQKGRYRQFYQFGAEVYGLSGPEVEAELLGLSWRFWQHLGIAESVTLQLNTLGTASERVAYREALVDYFSDHLALLDESSRQRLHKNPLRLLDSKDEALKPLIEQAPVLMDYLGAESREHFELLTTLLRTMNIPYEVSPRLVRGLDYYSHTVFEWVTDTLGAQGTVCAGGRYDGLVAQLGGPETPAFGFAMGIERLVLMLSSLGAKTSVADVYLILVGDEAKSYGVSLAESLRTALPQLSIESNLSSGSFKSQFKKADKSGAKWAIIVAQDEIDQGLISLKPLREEGSQETISVETLIQRLSEEG